MDDGAHVSAVLGVDPAATGTGAAVLRVDGEVAACWAWTWLDGRGMWRVRTSDASECVYPGASVGTVGYVVGCDVARRVGSARLVVEGLYAAPRWKQAKGGAAGADVLKLAEATGRTIEGMVRAGLIEPERPTWKEWAAPIGLASLAAKDAERHVVSAARRDGWLPRGLTAAEEVAVAEAAAMARWVGKG